MKKSSGLDSIIDFCSKWCSSREKPVLFLILFISGSCLGRPLVLEDNLFSYSTHDGKNIHLGISFIYPFVKDKSTWPYAKDVMYWDEWPVRHPFLLFGGLNSNNDQYLSLRQSLNADFSNSEVIRNMPVRYPLLWISGSN